MITLPSFVDFNTSAAAALAKARGVTPASDTRDPWDVAVALKCMSSFQLLEDEEIAALDEEAFAAPLISAARTLLSTAEQLSLADSENHEQTSELTLLSAIAFAMCGNFPSAAAALKGVAHEFQIRTPLKCVASVICNSRATLAVQENDPIAGIDGFRFHWFYALRKRTMHERATHYQQAETILKNIATRADANTFDKSFALSLLIAARQAFRLATANIYNAPGGMPDWFVENSISNGLVTLLPPQRKLLIDNGITTGNQNSLLTLPTSTGKTFIAECAIAAASQRGGICVYVAPYVAIGEQVRNSLNEKRFADRMQVVSMFGGFKSEFIQNAFSTAVIIATPERFDSWLRTTEQLASLRLVVMDEIHIIENGIRGSRVEGLLSRLRILQSRLTELRIMGLSAVLPETSALSNWLGIADEQVQRIGWRPTARRLATCDSVGNLTWIHGNDALRPAWANPDTAISVPHRITLPEDVYPSINTNSLEISAAKNVRTITLELLSRLGITGLVVCPRRSDTRALAREVATTFPETEDEELKSLAREIRARHAWLAPLASFIERGIAYHNASLPHAVRRSIEKAIREERFRLVCSTTTLAEGADFPFRWTLVSHWLSSFRNGGAPMRSMTFRNIAGRSGRAGWFTEGDTVIFENTIGPKEAFGGRGKHPEPTRLTKVMFSSAPVASTLGVDWEVESEEEQRRTAGAFASQLLACIRENPNLSNIGEVFANATYSSRSAGPATIMQVVNSTLAYILDATQPGGALAEQNSPIKLTSLGHASNQCGFSPRSVRAILRFLSESRAPLQDPEFLCSLLVTFGRIDEQPNYILHKVVGQDKHLFPMKEADLPYVIRAFLNGVDVRKIFDGLPARATSKASPDNVDKKFDEFVTFVDSVMASFLPWLLRAMDLLAPFAHPDARDGNWLSLAVALEARSVDADDANSEPANDF
ncbi:DEAD/DEAH box helicase [Paucibacter sp. M5-1]|uniref:DEAD/DEAH box helicase n=1 Tax=Paucibacter sp. M5-1 TaxID=3015998 RepID=UPI0022B8D594|nr:DEAD/DEAH box helicase [Paucibacter sp. M5-1]MCZ7881893.1 DEAD/DEAH box helicase [Paucibacter sp. M5-1]